MAQSGIISLPMLRGPLVASGPWQSLLAQPNKRIYPFPTGSIASGVSTGVTISLHGLGEPIAVDDYIIVCTETSYGNSSMYIPDFSKIRKVTAVSSSEDRLTVAAVSVAKGDYILNIGADGASAPTSDPDLDAIVTLYDDLAGDATNSSGYLLTGTGGHFRGWLPSQTKVVDLLITDNSKNPEVVIPLFSLGATEVEDATIKTLLDDGTPTIANGKLFKTGGTTSITDFDDGVVGQTITILAAHTVTVTFNASIIKLTLGVDFDMVAGDTLTLTMFDDQVWVETGRGNNTA